MHTTKVIKNFTETELQKNIDIDASWHQDVNNNFGLFSFFDSIKIVHIYLLVDFILK